MNISSVSMTNEICQDDSNDPKTDMTEIDGNYCEESVGMKLETKDSEDKAYDLRKNPKQKRFSDNYELHTPDIIKKKKTRC